MQAGENIISRIVDLDTRAESLRVSAREKAARILSEAAREAEDQKLGMENRTSERVKQLSEEAARKRSLEVDKVKKEYAVQAEEIRNISSAKKDSAANMILSGMRGRSE